MEPSHKIILPRNNQSPQPALTPPKTPHSERFHDIRKISDCLTTEEIPNILTKSVLKNLNEHLYKNYYDSYEIMQDRRITTLSEFLNTGYPCHMAALKADNQLIKWLHYLGADFNRRDSNGNTPLMVVCRVPITPQKTQLKEKKLFEIRSCIQNLCTMGGDLLKTNQWGECALEMICRNGYWGVKTLNEFIQKIPNDQILLAVNTLKSSLYKDASITLINRLFESEYNLLQKNEFGQYPLEVICENTHSDSNQIIAYLMKLEPGELVKASSLLHVTHSVEVIDYLLDNGISIESLNNDHRTPLQKAIEKKKPIIIVEHLINKNANIYAEPLPFHFLANKLAPIEFFKLFCSKDIKKGLTDAGGNNALMAVCEKVKRLPRNSALQEYLKNLISLGFDLLQTNDLNECALEKIIEYQLVDEDTQLAILKEIPAEQFGHIPQIIHKVKSSELIAFFASKGIPLDTFDIKGNTPLYLAVDDLNIDLISALKINGADHLMQRPQTKFALMSGHSTPQKLLEAKIQFLQGRRKLLYPPEHRKSYEAQLSLCYSIQFIFDIFENNTRDEDIIEKLIDYKFLTEDQIFNIFLLIPAEKLRLVPQILHKVRGHKLINFLIEDGIPVDIYDSNGHTALYLAVENLDLDTVATLVLCGASECKPQGVKSVLAGGYFSTEALLKAKMDFLAEQCEQYRYDPEALKPLKIELQKCKDIHNIFSPERTPSFEFSAISDEEDIEEQEWRRLSF